MTFPSDLGNAQKAREILSRFDRLPCWPFSPLVIFTIGMATFFDFYDTVVIGLAIPALISTFHISIYTALYAVSMSLAGYVIGTLVGGYFSDRCGRRLAVISAVTLFTLGALFSALSPSMPWLIVCRFVVGLGIGAQTVNVSAYIGELAPAKCRGRISALCSVYGFAGFAVVPFAGMGLMSHADWGWRVLFFLGALGGCLILFMRHYFIQSIRWYVSQGHLSKAEALLEQAEQYTLRKVKELPPYVEMDYQPIEKSPSNFWKEIKVYWKQIVLLFAVWFVYYIGNFGWLTLSTRLFQDKGFDLMNSITMTALSSLGFVFGALLAMLFAERFERKRTIACVACLWSLALLCIGWMPQMICVVICGFIASSTVSFLVALMYTLTAESFPTAFRVTGVGLTIGLGHLSPIIGGQLIFAVYDFFKPYHLSFEMAFTSMAATGLLTAILVVFAKSMTGKHLLQ